MDLSDIDAIIFDSDGVLVDSEIIHIAVERKLLAEMGLHYDYRTYISRFMGLSNSDYYEELGHDYLAKTGDRFPSDFGERLRARIWPRIDAELKPIPGVRELVDKFAGPVAVASSAVLTRLHHKLKLTGLFDFFQPHIYSSDHVANGKPAPDLFLHAAAKLGVTPSRCMVIEDSINGVVAGRKAEMLTIGFVGGSHADEGQKKRLTKAGAHFVVERHSDLVALL